MDNKVETKTTQEILERLARLETKLDNFNSFRDKVDITHNMACRHDDDIKDLKDSYTWLNRLVMGAIILGIIGAVIKFS